MYRDLSNPEHLPGLDLEIRGLTLQNATEQWLVHEVLGVRQAATLALGPGTSDEGAHRGRLTDDVGGHVTLDEVHRVDDAQASGDRSTR